MSALQIKKNAFLKAENDLELMKKLIEANAGRVQRTVSTLSLSLSQS